MGVLTRMLSLHREMSEVMDEAASPKGCPALPDSFGLGMRQLSGFKQTRGTISSLRVLNRGVLRLGPLQQQRQSLFLLHRLPRNKFLGEHIHSAKQRQLEEKSKKIQVPEDQ